jgi:hypothetical protein
LLGGPLDPHLLQEGLEGPLDLGEDLGWRGHLQAKGPSPLHRVDGHIHEVLPLDANLAVNPQRGLTPQGQIGQGLALHPDALLGQLLVQLGQALKVHLVEALQVHGRVQGMGDGVKLRHSLAHKHGH